jgi:hypothetical protein
VFNQLELEPAPDGLAIFRPQPGRHRLIYQVKLGATYRFGFGR